MIVRKIYFESDVPFNHFYGMVLAAKKVLKYFLIDKQSLLFQQFILLFSVIVYKVGTKYHVITCAYNICEPGLKDARK